MKIKSLANTPVTTLSYNTYPVNVQSLPIGSAGLCAHGLGIVKPCIAENKTN